MGTNLEKVNYLKDTKGLFKERLNSLGANILQNTTFRNYLTWLDDLYTSISAKTITNTKCLYGNTTQTGTPTPSSPIPIDVITGRQEISVVGKNLFDKNTPVNQTFTSSIATALQNYIDTGQFAKGYPDLPTNNQLLLNAQYLTAFIPVEQGEIYTAYCGEGRNFAQIFMLDGDGNIISYSTRWISTPYTHTVTSQEKYMMIGLSLGTILSTQVEKGSTATSYEAYKGNTYEVNLGKNLLNIGTTSDWETGGSVATDGRFAINNNVMTLPVLAYGNTYLWNNYKYRDSGTYTVSFEASITGARSMLRIRNSDDTDWLTGSDISITGYNYNSVYKGWYKDNASTTSVVNNITIPSGTWSYFVLGLGLNNSTYNGTTQTLTNIQLEKGSQATSYSEYFTPIELCKIGDVQDRIYKQDGNWYLEKKIGKIDSYNGETITTSYISTTGGLDTGATVYYVLATPTTEEITNDELISQLNEIEIYTLLSDDLVS